MRRDLAASHVRAHKLGIPIHDFMNAPCPDCERTDGGVLITMIDDGLIPMCTHNAKRGDFILKLVPLGDGEGWRAAPAHARETLKGRRKAAAQETPRP